MASYQYNDEEALKTLVPKGDYFCEIVNYEFGYSNNGNETLTLSLKQEPDGVIVYDVLTFTDKAFWRIDIMIKCMLPSKGIPKLDKGKRFEIDSEWCEKYLMNARGPVALLVEEYNGKEKNKVAVYNVPTTRPAIGTSPKFERNSDSNTNSAAEPPSGPAAAAPKEEDPEDAVPF